ncbi:hypothetical protein D9611_006158 [Ephemerocybe angulata]|uniref:Uncharacterized protein n=1 Tax=Ephemerocybe angulata TaxID=980116 RepID=A0A8H5CFX9_9AGAR|nr:hypothetical protein D9611_006158 [Tulosesus angulatus]
MNGEQLREEWTQDVCILGLSNARSADLCEAALAVRNPGGQVTLPPNASSASRTPAPARSERLRSSRRWIARSLDPRPPIRSHGTPIPISFPFSIFTILFLGVTTYVSLDIGLGVMQLIGGVESPAEALRNIPLFVLTSAA